MRVLLFTYFFPPAYSGEATYVHELALGIRERGHEVQVFAAGLPDRPGCNGPSWVHFVDVPNVSRTENFELFRETFSKQLFKTAMDIGSGKVWDVVHVQEWFCAEAASMVAKALNIPLVKTLHFVPPFRLIRSSLRWRLADLWQQRACADANEVIAVGHDLGNEALARYHVPAEKISVVHNGVNSALFARVDKPSFADRPLTLQRDRGPLVVSVARLVDQKGIDLLLKSIPIVLKQNSLVRWVICGAGPAQGAVPDEYLEESRKFSGAVQFTGHLPRLMALGWTSAADLFVAPSRFEPFGISVLEAMLLGKPVIASAVGGPKEMIEHNVSGLLLQARDVGGGWAEVDPSELARSQIAVLSDNVLAARLGKKAQSEALKRFSYADFVSNTLAVFEKAIASRANFSKRLPAPVELPNADSSIQPA